VAIVGAGPGGAYLAWRLSEATVGRQVCLFEMGQRVGGRVHSLRKQGPQRDLTVEAGAYRFALNRTCAPIAAGAEWCISTPVTTHLIVDHFKLPYKVYDPSATEWDDKLAKIVDARGDDAGYLTFVEALVDAALATGRVTLRFGHELLRLDAPKAAASPFHVLHFANGHKVSAGFVVLNLPQYPLLRVLGASTGLSPRGAGAVPPVLRSVTAYPIFKLYVHYADAWWRNALGLANGFFNNTAAWKTEAADPRAIAECFAARQLPAPLAGAYHDAHVKCEADGGRCRGYLQAAYIGDAHGVRFYAQWRKARSGDSVTMLDGAHAADADALALVHDALVELHRDALIAAGALERVVAMRPDSGVLSIWDSPVDGIETGCHVFMEPGAPGAPAAGIPKARIPAEAMSPFASAPRVFVANEAWGALQCFAEGSLQMAENLAHSAFGAHPPAWIPALEYAADVLYSNNTGTLGAATPAPAYGDLSIAHAAAVSRTAAGR
jgi:hypothetical protein